MRVAVFVLALVAAAAATNELYKETPFSKGEVKGLFDGWKREHGMTFATKKEEAKRFRAFADNVEFIRAHNVRHSQGLETYKTGLNHLCHLTNAEYRQMYMRPMNRTRPLNEKYLPVVHTLTGQAASVDWRSKGAVTPVKNQGQCGSCWSFSTTGATEGAYQIAFGELNSLSEQQLMDCSTAEGDHSCQGGLMDFAFKYINENGGVDSESDYPYLARNEACKKDKESRHIADVASYTDVPKGNEDQLMSAVNIGPVAVAIEADQRGFQTYSSGVFSGLCGKQLDHGVLAVGYGTEDGKDYWIVKNSWGASWGDAGYIKLKRGSDECGIADSASYPKASKVGPSPPPSPSPSPAPPSPSPSGTDYEDPKPNGCASGEQAVKINGVSGDYCAPSCNGAGSTCPPAPDGATAEPTCAVEKPGSSGPSLCALICKPSSNAECPGASTCKSIQGVGICTYDD